MAEIGMREVRGFFIGGALAIIVVFVAFAPFLFKF
jgi:hypothetical protein